jgi:hypothetical protein
VHCTIDDAHTAAPEDVDDLVVTNASRLRHGALSAFGDNDARLHHEVHLRPESELGTQLRTSEAALGHDRVRIRWRDRDVVRIREAAAAPSL